jgi:hypothetical protein
VPLVGQKLQDWQEEGRGLAGSGLSPGQQIMAGKDLRDSLGLDWRRMAVTLATECTHEVGAKTE